MMEDFGLRLRKLRRDADISQADLAAEIGVVPSAVGKYERSPNAYPSVEVVVRIARFFNVTTDYLLLGTKNSSLVENNISGNLSNSSFVQANNGGVVFQSEVVSPESAELLQIYNTLTGKERLRLLSFALTLESESQ